MPGVFELARYECDGRVHTLPSAFGLLIAVGISLIAVGIAVNFNKYDYNCFLNVIFILINQRVFFFIKCLNVDHFY